MLVDRTRNAAVLDKVRGEKEEEEGGYRFRCRTKWLIFFIFSFHGFKSQYCDREISPFFLSFLFFLLEREVLIGGILVRLFCLAHTTHRCDLAGCGRGNAAREGRCSRNTHPNDWVGNVPNWMELAEYTRRKVSVS